MNYFFEKSEFHEDIWARYEDQKTYEGHLKHTETLEMLDDEMVWKYIIKDSSELGKYQEMWEWLVDDEGNRTWWTIFRYTKTAYIPKVKFKPVNELFPVIYYERQWWRDTSRFFLAIYNSDGKMLTKELVHAFVKFDFDVDTTNHTVDTIIGYDYIKNVTINRLISKKS